MGLRISIFHFNEGYERDQDFYLDVGDYSPGPLAWHAEDLYLDLVVRTGVGVELVDVDELMEAVQERLVTPETAKRAVLTAASVIDGLARNDYDVGRWLAGRGMVLTWLTA
jgi:predicted RNA-binding protein associated with RNAse of E/G family